MPERVLVIDPTFSLAMALELGLPVVGAPLDLMTDTKLKDEALTADVTSIGLVTEPSLERIVALQQDLIVGLAGSESRAAGIHGMATQLAPTLLYTSPDWKAFYRLLGRVAGKEAAVAEVLDTYEARVADLRERMPGTKVSVLRITSWDFQVYLDAPNAYAPFAILRDAGVQRSPYETTDDPSLSLKRPDREELAALVGEILLYIVGGTNASDTNGRHEEVLADPLFKMLPAVQAGRLHRVDHATWMEFSGLRSAHQLLDQLEEYIIGAE
ncbi:MAG: ABC transporter substrate-binding protein [Marinovum sp.]|nr:ABC transporter substrate-binding protein [Marinovum sp.]